MPSRGNATLVLSSVVIIVCAAAAWYYVGYETSETCSLTQTQKKENTASVERSTTTTTLRRSLKPRKDCTIEICLSDIQSLRNALAGGCNSIELCVDRPNGGVTPSIGLIEQAVLLIGGRDVALHILIRPRPGGFVYSDDEFDIIQRDIIAAKVAGADGVVFGALDAQGRIDIPRMKLARELSKGMLLTFHRAFDVCGESHAAALETIIGLGCDRLLTSGGAESSALRNAAALKELQRLAGGRIEIVAAAGVSEENAADLLHATGGTALHAGSSVCRLLTSQGTATTPATPTAASSSSPACAQSRDSPGIESFIAVDPSEAHSPKPPGNSTGSNSSSSSSTAARALEELRAWQCVNEEAVVRLVAIAKATVTQRKAATTTPATAAAVRGNTAVSAADAVAAAVAATIGSIESSTAADAEYVRL